MTERFAQMNCFVLAGGQKSATHFQEQGDTTRLEKSYRRYASLFEQVSLVLKKEQARERYLNYPHVCDSLESESILAGVASALENARSEAVFIGSAELSEFPLELIVKLVREYDGESFLGYYDPASGEEKGQPLFGIYHRRLAEKIEKLGEESSEQLARLLAEVGRLVPLPQDVPAASIGIG